MPRTFKLGNNKKFQEHFVEHKTLTYSECYILLLWRNDLVEGSWMQARFWNKVGRKSLFLGPQSKPKTSKGNKASLSSIKEVKYIAVTVRLSLKIWIIDHLNKRSAIAPYKKGFF